MLILIDTVACKDVKQRCIEFTTKHQQKTMILTRLAWKLPHNPVVIYVSWVALQCKMHVDK